MTPEPEIRIESQDDFIHNTRHYRGVVESPHSGQKIGAQITVTKELIADAKFQFEGYVSDRLRQEINKELETEIDAMEAYDKAIAEYEGRSPNGPDFDCQCEPHIRRRKQAEYDRRQQAEYDRAVRETPF